MQLRRSLELKVSGTSKHLKLNKQSSSGLNWPRSNCKK
ncbi:unnamed protein product [Protopolystoma xenopodis]|uniref:Uncharacterized protein n=1 Tax=Protopolystoma xenopodis TaxID=117903 RepID=A0A3S5BV94_9PLAT|nr:unnamed protein product [Protopolystoma xenopodis]